MRRHESMSKERSHSQKGNREVQLGWKESRTEDPQEREPLEGGHKGMSWDGGGFKSKDATRE